MQYFILLIIGLCLAGCSDEKYNEWSSLENKAFRQVTADNIECSTYAAQITDKASSISYEKEQSYYLTYANAMISYKSCQLSIKEARAYACVRTKGTLKDGYVATLEFPSDDCELASFDNSEMKQCNALVVDYGKKFIMPLMRIRYEYISAKGDFDTKVEYKNYIAGKYTQKCGYEG
jgi:hypothetical protein